MAVLDSIIGNMPVANQRRQQQVQAANDLQLQQAVRAAPPKAATPQVTQQLGAAVQQNVGQQIVDTAKQNLQVNQQAAGTQLQNQATQIQSGLADLRRGQDTQQLDAERQFANINEQAKREMFDNRLEFQKDEQGRAFMNERQLADYAATHARDQNQFQNYQQSSEHLHDRQTQLLEAGYNKLTQELEFQNSLSNQKQDQQLKLRLEQARKDLENKIAKEKARKANRAGKFQAVGTVVGAVAGGVIGSAVPVVGTAAGAVVGASVGGALGSGAAAATE